MPLLDEKIYANALNLIPPLGPVKLTYLFKHFETWEKAWKATRAMYVSAGLNPKNVEQIVSYKDKIDPEKEFEKLTIHGIEIILINSQEYPKILGEISAAPPILYVRGNKRILDTACIAIVGTRKMSSYGRQACEEIVTGLANANLTIVSGLAFGIDGTVLNSAINLNAPAIAVLATPLDDASIGPKTNFQLSQKLIEKGALVSEYPLGASVQKQNFPIRNRIIAGLSMGTIVIEADNDSGSLITANFALEQNREVFAVPGSIFSEVSRGSNNLIKKGAKLVSSYTDVLEELNLDLENLPEPEIDITTDETESKVLEILTRDPIHVDDLTRILSLPAATVNATLVLLEMKGRVRSVGGAKFSKIR
jgi:DNA processing protein